MKILLTYLSGEKTRKDPYISLVPTGLCFLHARLLEAGHDSLLANFSGWSRQQIDQELLRFRPDLVGISQWTHNRHASMELASICRIHFPSCLIVMGGAHATFRAEDVLENGSPVDIVIKGEGEQTLLELVYLLENEKDWSQCNGLAFKQNGTICNTPTRLPLQNLDQLPHPSRYLEKSVGLNLQLQPEFIVTARGCPSACYFCSSPAFWGRKVRFRSPQDIVDEILYIREKFGLIYFSIRDDTFTADRNRTQQFCSILIEQKANILWNCQSRVNAIDEELLIMMKRAGCECIQLGVESGAPRILKKLGKKIVPDQIQNACELIRLTGINLSIYLISDVPGETAEDTKQTIELIRRINPDDGYVSPLAYYPGTKLHEDAVASGQSSDKLFSDSTASALYVSKKHGETSRKMLHALSASRNCDPDRFTQEKDRLGFCYTTNVLAGEFYRQSGKYRKAEDEFLEITKHLPENPWAWFLLGELYSETGKPRKARDCFVNVLKTVPNHQQSQAALSG